MPTEQASSMPLASEESVQLPSDKKPVRKRKPKRTVESITAEVFEPENYKENSAGYIPNVTIFHRKNAVSPDMIKTLLKVSNLVNRNIYLICWSNDGAAEFVKKVKKQDSNSYFILTADPDLRSFYDKGQSLISHFKSVQMEIHSDSRQMEYYNDIQHVFGKTDRELHSFCDGNGNYVWKDGNGFSFFRYSYFTENLNLFQLEAFSYSFAERVIQIIKHYKDESPTVKSDYYTSKYSGFFERSLTNVKNTVQGNLAAKSRELSQQYQACVRAESQLRDLNESLKGCIKKIEELKGTKINIEQIKRGFEAALKDRFTSFSFGDSIISGTTSPIYLQYCRSVEEGGDGMTLDTFHIGTFEIKVSLDGKVQLFNITKQISGEYDHPHVLEGSPCLGNMAQAIPKLIFEYDFIAVFLLMHDYLMTFNRFGWYGGAEVYQWPLVKVRPSNKIKLFNKPIHSCTHCGIPTPYCDEESSRGKWDCKGYYNRIKEEEEAKKKAELEAKVAELPVEELLTEPENDDNIEEQV